MVMSLQCLVLLHRGALVNMLDSLRILRSPSTPLLIIALAFSPFGANASSQEQQPAPPAHDMEHMQHTHGGFMQEGMHHGVAKGIKLEQQVDPASHTITVREGPLTLPASTSHMMMPQPPDVFWTITLDGFLLAYTPRLVDANGN